MKRRIVANPSRYSRISAPHRPSPTLNNVELERLKRFLLAEHQRAVSDPDVQARFDLAANEAASIAWATTYPLLVFPLLLQEKVQEAERKARVQRGIYRRSQKIMTLAA